MKYWKILIVESEPRCAQLIDKALSREGFGVRIVTDPFVALELLTGARADLILVDDLMPGMTGFEFARRVRNEPALAGVPVVITSERNLKGDPRLRSAGCVGFVPKPICIQTLGAQLRSYAEGANECTPRQK